MKGVVLARQGGTDENLRGYERLNDALEGLIDELDSIHKKHFNRLLRTKTRKRNVRKQQSKSKKQKKSRPTKKSKKQ
tara:strand:- start:94 stop:324 length:231 start_codon:yes stop_codon:yes gene_type:complete